MLKKIFLILSFWLVGVFSQPKPIDIASLTGDYNSQETKAVFEDRTINCPLADQAVNPSILGEKSQNKRIEVDLTNQRLYAFEGNNKVFDFLISSGKWGRTPTGTFWIWVKLRYSKMEGGSKTLNTYYYLPNVPFVMYFFNDEIPKYRGFGIHGTYWHDNFGHPMSHGCINMKTEEAGQLFYWANPNLNGKKSV